MIERGETHLHVELRKLRLAVGAQVFIAETTSNLKVFIQTGNHAQLLEQLWRLRQGEKLTRLHARGNDVVARAFGSRLDQDRSFNFGETLFVHVAAYLAKDPMPQPKVGLKLGPAEIKVAILQAQIFAGERIGGSRFELKRQRARVVEQE